MTTNSLDSSCAFSATITEEDVATFSRLTGDVNPLHVDPEYAKQTEFGRPVAHGALLVGLVSRVLGMHIPGRRSLILSMKVRFPKPLFFPAKVDVTGKLVQFDQDRGAGIVGVTIVDSAKLWPVLESEVSFALHSSSSAASTLPARVETPRSTSERCRLLVTGGTGGLGSAVTSSLEKAYDLSCLTRREISTDSKTTTFVTADLENPGSLEGVLNELSPADFYGILHMSAPPMARGFASDDPALVGRYMRHCVDAPLLLARWARRPGSAVKRLIFVGSTAGSLRPQPQAGAYSLGKAALDHLAKLMVGDMAAQGATVNVVAPSLVPVGMNEGLSERARKALAGRMPTARLVAPADVVQVIEFLLSPGSAQVNGAVIAVDGGLGE